MTDDLRSRMRHEGLAPTPWSNGAGDRYGAHDHGYDKVIVVERGSIRFGIGSATAPVELSVGDRLDLPAGTRHDALVGQAGVTCLEAHLPAGTLGRVAHHLAGTWHDETDAPDRA